MISLTIEEESHARGLSMPMGLEKDLADELASNAAETVGEELWENLLTTFTHLIKRQPARGGKPKTGGAEAFIIELDRCRYAAVGDVKLVLDMVWEGREHVRSCESASDSILRELDPTVPAPQSPPGRCGSTAPHSM